MKINQTDHIAYDRRRQGLIAAASILAGLAASSCCILPLTMFALGVSGAWISNFTWLAPYQPYFIAIALGFLGYGYWLVRRSRKCIEGDACTRPLPRRVLKGSLLLATILVVAALSLDFIVAPFLNGWNLP